MGFNAFDVVRVPFPFTDRDAEKRRPALVLSDDAVFNAPAGHSVMAMITSQGHSPWPLDIPIEDIAAAGLPSPSIIRFKLFMLDHSLVLGLLGHLASEDAQRVSANLRQLLGEALASRMSTSS